MKHQKKHHRKTKNQGVSDISVRKKILWAMGIFGVLAFAVLTGQLVKLMLIDHDYYEEKAIRNQTRSTSVTATRGTIYDCNMNVLAASASVENIFLDPLELKEHEVDVDALAAYLGNLLAVDPDWIRDQAADTQMRYKMIKRRQEKEICDQVREYISKHDIVGVHMEPDSRRYYPYNALASQVLGFTNTENVGSEGLEAYYNDMLEGTAGAVITTKGNNETEMLYSYETYYEASDGDSLVLTVDTTVQRILEKQMQNAIDRYDVQNGAFGIIMDVDTGEILAMSTLGGYDPNHYLEIYNPQKLAAAEELYDTAEALPENSPQRKEAFRIYNQAVADARLAQWRNRCVSDGYEPGSTFKVLTLAAGLDSGGVHLEDEFYCGGSEKFEGRQQILNCWKTVGHGAINTAQALQGSCNIAFAHMALNTGGDVLYDYYKAFGLMETTGVDLTGESRGIFHSREKLSNNAVWGTSHLISTSFGQTIKITPIQLVRAIGAVVNGGYVLEPYIVSQVMDGKGNIVEKHGTKVINQAISNETSETMCRLLESVVTEGTAGNAKVVGYRIGGKTGTSEKVDQLNSNDKIVSFVGTAPMEDPRYVVLVALDTPNPESGLYVSGGIMAAPTVAAVFEDILPYLGAEASYTAEDMDRVNVSMPSVVGLTEEEAAEVLKKYYLDYELVGGGTTIKGQIPASGKAVPGYSTVLLYTDDSMPTDQTEVPDLKGMTVAEATSALNDRGLYLQAKGTDSTAWHVLVTSQDIAPGVKVARGTTITVIFADTTAID